MAVEYLYDAIRATSGENVNICAIITDDEGILVTDSCWLILSDDEKEIEKIYGGFDGEQWSFTIPSQTTTGLSGRYWYEIGRNFEGISFRTPIYFV